ncbi:MAG: tRNA (guanosine(46)-N7)-methyltransferase TrmB [candidate division Zixibacteria bacterium]|nr:tRNA (guanosine(46)-N7)-methyltransferase TrmB [candidate division Zixibacteria bacterium]
MSKGKLAKFAELATFSNVFEYEPLPKGRWAEDFFKNGNPITLELACGKAEYTIDLARTFPERNFIGIDLKGARIWRGAKNALEMKLANVGFIRQRIELLTDMFTKDEISEIWITFPDPYPRKCKARKRLTSPRFLDLYRQVLKPNGLIHLKTDELNLFEYTKETLAEQKCIVHEVIDDVYAGPIIDDVLSIKTTFEKSHLAEGRTIRYLRFSFD